MASPRDLTTREQALPWAQSSLVYSPGPVKDAPWAGVSRTAAGAACSRAATAGSARGIPRPVTVAASASKPPGAGGAGVPPNAIAPATTVSSSAGSKADATGSASGRSAQLPRHPRARASAQPPIRKILWAAPATAPVATNFSSPRCVVPTSVSVVAHAVRRYAVSGSERSGGANGGVKECGPDGYGPALHPAPPPECRHLFFPVLVERKLLRTPRGGRSGRGEFPSSPRFLSPM